MHVHWFTLKNGEAQAELACRPTYGWASTLASGYPARQIAVAAAMLFLVGSRQSGCTVAQILAMRDRTLKLLPGRLSPTILHNRPVLLIFKWRGPGWQVWTPKRRARASFSVDWTQLALWRD